MEDTVKRIILGLGADVCGIAAVDTFQDAPKGFHPTDIYKDCKSVIAFGIALPTGLYAVNPRITYLHGNNLGLAQADQIAFQAAKALEALGAVALPVPSDGPYDFWEETRLEGRGILSMRHIAKLAGIGSMGKNTLIINRHYGNRLNLGAILTNLSLQSDPPAEDLCIKGCRKCLDACPTKALDGVTVRQDLCRPHTYATNARGFSVCNCNTCRIICPLSTGVQAAK